MWEVRKSAATASPILTANSPYSRGARRPRIAPCKRLTTSVEEFHEWLLYLRETLSPLREITIGRRGSQPLCHEEFKDFLTLGNSVGAPDMWVSMIYAVSPAEKVCVGWTGKVDAPYYMTASQVTPLACTRMEIINNAFVHHRRNFTPAAERPHILLPYIRRGFEHASWVLVAFGEMGPWEQGRCSAAARALTGDTGPQMTMRQTELMFALQFGSTYE
jgi:hypothetical protein